MSKILIWSNTLKVAMPNACDLVLGDQLSIDLMLLHGKAVIHNLDTARHILAATFPE